MHKGHDRGRSPRRSPIVRSSPVGKSTVDINLLGTVHSHNAHVGGVLRRGAIEEGFVVGAVVVIIASALLTLLT